jgi:hypothetical protein
MRLKSSLAVTLSVASVATLVLAAAPEPID